MAKTGTSSFLFERFANGSRPVIDSSSSCVAHVRQSVPGVHDGFPYVSCCPMERTFVGVGAARQIRRQQRGSQYGKRLLHVHLDALATEDIRQHKCKVRRIAENANDLKK